MDEELLSQEHRIYRFLQENLLVVVIFCVGFIFILIGIFQIFSKKEPEITFSAGESKEEAVGKIAVDIEGAVIKPGVYSLSSDARIQDALIAAGGVSGGADRAYISKSLNLAQKLTDGAKLYIPQEGEIVSLLNLSSSGQSQGGLVSINNATASELDSLPGVGQVTAQKIIDNRPYQDISELLSKKVVGESLFNKIKNDISL